jgi:hypothetical protein
MAEYQKPNPWIPFWIDKWLFGSTRIELLPDERSVWLDLLALASKNSGYIRANDTTPYPISQLAGLLIISEELLIRTIEKCVQYDKIVKNPDGTIKIPSWDKYQLSPRQKRRYSKTSDGKEDVVSEEEDTVSKKKVAKNKRNKNKVNKKKANNTNFKIPTLEEIKEYCLERKNKVDPDRFCNFYESKGWMIGKNKMKDWRAAVRTWENSSQQTTTPTPRKSPITVEVAKDMLARAAVTDTMIEVLERLPEDELKLFMKTVVNKDSYTRGLYQRAKKILKKKEVA